MFVILAIHPKSWVWHNKSNLKVCEVISIKVSIRLHLENETKRTSLVLLKKKKENYSTLFNFLEIVQVFNDPNGMLEIIYNSLFLSVPENG